MNDGGWLRRLVNRSRPAALGLRRRILLIFTLGALLLSVFLATTTYGLTRSSIVSERVDSAISTSQRNAQGVERDLRSRPADADPATSSLERIGVQDYLIWYADRWTGGAATFQNPDIPPALVTRVVDEGLSASQIVRIGEELSVVVGWDVPAIGAYFQAFSLEEANSTLASVGSPSRQ